jgi:hypothetical protein
MSDEYAEDPHGAGDVLELARTFVREADVELATQFLAHATRDADPARLRQRRQPHRYVDGDAPMSAPSAMTSPTLMPTRNSGRLCDAPALRLSIVR